MSKFRFKHFFSLFRSMKDDKKKKESTMDSIRSYDSQNNSWWFPRCFSQILNEFWGQY